MGNVMGKYRYVIEIRELKPNKAHTPEGMSGFSLCIRENDDYEAWSGFYAPSDLAYLTNTPHDAIRLASFFCMEGKKLAEQDYDSLDGDEQAFCEMFLDMESSLDNSSEPMMFMKIRDLKSDAFRLIKWPEGYSTEELANHAKAELTRGKLTKVSEQVRSSHSMGSSSKPKM